jgi:hypothetical protein
VKNGSVEFFDVGLVCVIGVSFAQCCRVRLSRHVLCLFPNAQVNLLLEDVSSQLLQAHSQIENTILILDIRIVSGIIRSPQSKVQCNESRDTSQIRRNYCHL